jgi:hypothetical protein
MIQGKKGKSTMRKNMQLVITKFAGRSAKSGDTCSTDGEFLYSYKMKIARINADFEVRLLEYNQAPSNTTRSHIRAAEEYFGKVTRVHDSADL